MTTFEYFNTCSACGAQIPQVNEVQLNICKECDGLGTIRPKVEATILALLAASGPCDMAQINAEVKLQVPGIDKGKMNHVLASRTSLLEQGLIEADSETLDSVTAYDLSDSYYPSEHNPNNYGYDMTEFESRIWS